MRGKKGDVVEGEDMTMPSAGEREREKKKERERERERQRQREKALDEPVYQPSVAVHH